LQDIVSSQAASETNTTITAVPYNFTQAKLDKDGDEISLWVNGPLFIQLYILHLLTSPLNNDQSLKERTTPYSIPLHRYTVDNAQHSVVFHQDGGSP